MNPAFEKHAAYMAQAWRTLQDSVLLKTPLQGNALRNHQASGCTGCRKCDSDKQDILKPQIPVKDSAKLMAERRGAEREALGEETQGGTQEPGPLAGDWVRVTSEEHARRVKYAKFVEEQAERERANKLAERQARIKELERTVNQNQVEFQGE